MISLTAAEFRVHGHPDDAIKWLQRSIAGGYHAGALGLHIDKELDALRGRAEFEAVIRPRG